VISRKPLDVLTIEDSSPWRANASRTAAGSTFGSSKRTTQRVPPV
jgi:hypothetical protein